MLAKLICYGDSREHAIHRLDRALRDYAILGVTTNVSWLRRVVTNPAFGAGKVSTRFIADHEADLAAGTPDVVPEIAAVLARRREPRVESRGVPSIP